MQSFGRPRPTTNPYIHMLDEALAGTPGIEHLRFDRRRALLGRYDALQLHWPETLFGGSTPSRALARRAFALALRARLTITPVAVLRTVHNLEPHSSSTPWERRYLAWLERRTDHRIVLQERTTVPPGAPTTLIRHGHYRDWFASAPATPATPGVLGFVGLVRPYKGVEELLDAFATTRDSSPQLRLRVAGRPTSAALERELRGRAERDPRVELDLRHLPDAAFANAVMRASGVVLPYRAMHNSGSALAALSLDRPVLVPRSDATEALASEVGPGWVSTFDGPLTGDDLERFAASVSTPPAAPPELGDRGWDGVGAAHRSAFVAAVERRRRRARA
ncbi:GDP-mannose--glycolipid 4-beta-D-mannosyltransferase [Agrococcus citreus]|uniref:GDP-mannose--glycolipid 4-beta-D-mannosyltransferase n=2 Tax=Agrococcus citreus TaxID=84643 RepID=A0ABN1YM41_9MICO